jgi:mannose-6-phosphate isomerase
MPVLNLAAVKAGPAVTLLERKLVAKPWGRREGGGWSCGADFAEPVGEIHHMLPLAGAARSAAGSAAGSGAEPADSPDTDILGADALLVKTLLTRAVLSVQVHPDAAAARAMGMPRGKDEAWLVLAAEPGARVGLGLKREMSAAALAAAVADGSIVDAMVWHTVAPGDVLVALAGTVHALGAGVTVLEVQENNDLTWRLFDHGRGRKLEVEKGLAVARREAWVRPAPLSPPGPGRTLLCAGAGFVMERVAGKGLLRPNAGRPVWLAALEDGVVVGGRALGKGAVALVSEAAHVTGPDAQGAGVLLAQAGAAPQAGLWAPEAEDSLVDDAL